MPRLHTIHFLLFALSLQACAQNTDIDKEVKKLYSNTVPVISPEQVKGKAVLLDARERSEYDVSHLPKARWVGYDDFDLKRLAGIPKSDTVIVYCSIGYRSERIGEQLIKAGYTKVFNLYGGIFQWKNSDGAVVDANNDTTERVHCYDRSWSRFLKKGEKVY
jgi:rhodanese-related sulfurtransferase